MALRSLQIGARTRRAWLRPSEAVAAYIEREAAQRQPSEGNRLPTIRQVAEDLDVSVRTVQSVFQKLARQGMIRTKVGKGSFLATSTARNRDILDIALGLHATAGAPDEQWSHPISSGILHAASQEYPRVKLLPLAHRLNVPSAAEDLLNEWRVVDGLILFPSPYGREIREVYESHGKPVVDLNPSSDTATANFVAPDYFGASQRIGRAWRETGRKHVVLMLHTSLDRSSSNRVRLSGLVNGIGAELGKEGAFRILQAEAAREDCGYATMKKFLEGPEACVDAVYCVSDHQALGAFRALKEHGLRIPEEVSLAGGTGLDLSTTVCPELTRMRQPLRQIGEALVNMLRQRIREERPVPAVILEAPWIGGATTRLEENTVLGIRSI
ncbi:MAG: substrate-binding domain-containing protein [Verrucomicrobiae bacterium]|nr:substrate-binding domain-containing protein [Verrucomicrobiae bacterium]